MKNIFSSLKKTTGLLVTTLVLSVSLAPVAFALECDQDKDGYVSLSQGMLEEVVADSPAAVLETTDDPAAAHALVQFLVSPEAQAAIASTGWQPVRPDVAWPYEGAAVAPDWDELFGSQQALLEDYRAIFGD